MKRKDYQEPTTLVVKLQHHGMLMESGVGAKRSGYGEANEGVSEGEKDGSGIWTWF